MTLNDEHNVKAMDLSPDEALYVIVTLIGHSLAFSFNLYHVVLY